MKNGGYAVFVVGEVRNEKGNYVNLVGDTIKHFTSIDISMWYYNEIILLNSIASASMRANSQFTSSRKVAKVHQNILVFKKP